MKRIIGSWVAVAVLAGMAPSVALASEEGVVSEVLSILKERGLVDEGEYQRLVSKNASYESSHGGWMPKLDFWGDFRARHEGFYFDEDETNSERKDRSRLRYRFRLNGKVEVNDHVSGFFRLASGSSDNRSTNQTLGSSLDFDSDPIVLDLAYVEVTPLSEMKDWKVRFGKVKNPFTWKIGKDFMLWDGDVNLEGASTSYGFEAAENLNLFANAGYFVLDENSTAKDPYLTAAQVGAHFEATDDVKLGGRATYYHFGKLNSAFSSRAADDGLSTSVTDGGGNILDGLTGDASGGKLNVVEFGAYLQWNALEAWPMTLYGNWSENLDAEKGRLVGTLGADPEDTAWGLGVEVGDKKEYVELGVGYWSIEANAFPSQFIDSDLFDGRTNREGWAFYGSRQVWKDTDLNLTVFMSDEIEDAAPFGLGSVPDAKRIRIQTDMVFKF